MTIRNALALLFLTCSLGGCAAVAAGGAVVGATGAVIGGAVATTASVTTAAVDLAIPDNDDED
ncbi:hypothetical protein [Roseibium sp.]|uniref:hypothetical protein n=1 Tax=Roseibium sp. TaxID=1936156 RepID=UPI003A981B71